MRNKFQHRHLYMYLGAGYFFILFFLIIGAAKTSMRLVWAGEIDPFISLGEKYTDNLFLEKEDLRDDYITTLEGGVKFSQGIEDRSVEGDYKGKLTYYKNYDEEDQKEYNGNIKASLGFGEKGAFSLKLNEHMYYEKRYYREPLDIRNHTQLKITTLSPTFRLSVGRGGLDIGYQYGGKRYDDPAFIDRYTYKGFLLLDQKIMNWHNITGILGYTYFNRDFKEKAQKQNYWLDYKEDKGNLGLKMEMPLDMKGQIKYILTRRKDDLGEIEYYTWVADVERPVGWRILAKLSYGIGTVEEIGEEVYGNKEKYHSLGGTAKITLREGHVIKAEFKEGFYQNIVGGIYKRRNSKVEINHEFRGRTKLTYSGYDIKRIYEEGYIIDSTLGGRASLEMFFTEVVSLLLSGDYMKTSYEPEGWQDKYSKSAAELTYHPLAWLSSSLNYAYIENRANEAEREYTNHRYGINIKAAF